MNPSDSVSENEIVTKPEFKFFKDYLIKTLQTIMDVEKDDLILKFNGASNESSLAKFLVNSQEYILLITVKEDPSQPTPEISCFLSINQIQPNCGEAIAIFKKQDLEIEKIKT